MGCAIDRMCCSTSVLIATLALSLGCATRPPDVVPSSERPGHEGSAKTDAAGVSGEGVSQVHAAGSVGRSADSPRGATDTGSAAARAAPAASQAPGAGGAAGTFAYSVPAAAGVTEAKPVESVPSDRDAQPVQQGASVSQSVAASDYSQPDRPTRKSSRLARVTLVSDLPEMAVGSTVVLRVVVDGAEDVASVPFHILFDPEVLEYQGAREGSFLAGDGQGTVFMVVPSSRGRLVVGHSRLTRASGISGMGELCTLNFVAVGSGDAGLAFERAAVIDNSGNEQPASFETTALELR